MLTVFITFICAPVRFIIKKIRSYCTRKIDNPIPKTSFRLTMEALVRVKKTISKESYKEVSIALSKILKKYLVYTFKYVHIEMTNSEIIDALRRDTSNDWQTLSQITEILSLTERVNFAKKRLNVAQQQGLCKKTGKIILKIWKIKKEKYENR